MNTASIKATLVQTVPVGNTLGEGVLWDELSARAWWTDIQARRLYRYDPRRSHLEHFDLPERLGSVGFVAGDERLIAAFESGFAFYHPDSGKLEWIERPPHAAANMRFNDGRVDRAGRFWAGSMVQARGEAHGKLYSLERGRAQAHLTGISISNSICFSPDGVYSYFADTPQRTIWRFNADAASGALSNRLEFTRTPAGAYPDGSAIDADGCLWNAQWGASRVMRYSPDGRESGTLDLPVSQPSCVAFGGEDLNWLFVTTAREDLTPAMLAREPQAGDLFVYEIQSRGLPEARYLA